MKEQIQEAQSMTFSESVLTLEYNHYQDLHLAVNPLLLEASERTPPLSAPVGYIQQGYAS